MATGTVVAAPPATHIDVEKVTESLIDQIASDPVFAEKVAEQLRGEKAFFAVPSEDLIVGDETYAVEFKSTARWNMREGRKDKRMEDAVVKTVAGFLNAEGGTLFIGVADDRRPVGLANDEALVRPRSPDGLVNCSRRT